MEAVKTDSGKRVFGGETVFSGPEEDAVVARAGKDSSARREASADRGAGADLDAAPDGAVARCAPGRRIQPGRAHCGDVEASGVIAGQDPPAGVEALLPFRKRSAAVERFERRAEEIASGGRDPSKGRRAGTSRSRRASPRSGSQRSQTRLSPVRDPARSLGRQDADAACTRSGRATARRSP